VGRGGQLMFYTHAPLWRINYAADLEVDGGADGRAVFGDIALLAWRAALTDWRAFGERVIVATTGEEVRVGSVESLRKDIDHLNNQLVALAGDVRAQIREEKRSALSEEEKALLLNRPAGIRPGQPNDVNAVDAKIYVAWTEVAARLEGEKKTQVEEWGARLSELGDLFSRTDNYAGQINYDDWLLRCEYESERETVQARELVYKGELALQVDANMLDAQEYYEEGFAQWRLVLDKYDQLLHNDLILQELIEPIRRYQQVMVNGLDNEFPDPFVLQDVMDAHARMQSRSSGPPEGVDTQSMPGVTNPLR